MLVNHTGSFIEGGSFADTGVTGRKLMTDSYGGVCRHGGGAFSGKDPTKIDRAGAYMASKIACAIGIAEPDAVSVNTFGTGKFSDDVLADLVRAKYNLTPRGIIEQLHLKDVDYNAVSAYGHLARPPPVGAVIHGGHRISGETHPDAIRQSPEAQYHLQCVYCGKEFIVYGNANRRYCCHNCYIRDRFWRAEEGREPYSPPKAHLITP